MDDLISVIVPIYNVEQYLERCIESIRCQTYKNIEIILVNDGSADKSGLLCDQFSKSDPRIKVIHKENGGLSSARNAGLKAAKGKFVGFVDSDDWIANDMYEYLYNLISKNEADVSDIACIYAYKYPCNIKDEEEKINIYNDDGILENYLYRGMHEQKSAPFSVCRKLYISKLFDDISFPEGKINEDICTNFKILSKCNRIVISNQIKYFYYQNIQSITVGELKQKDLALLDVCTEMSNLANKTRNKTIISLANMKLARSDFSLLARIAMYGCGSDIQNPQELITILTKRLRKNISLLLKSPMPVNRKILSLALCVNINILRIPVRLIKSLK